MSSRRLACRLKLERARNLGPRPRVRLVASSLPIGDHIPMRHLIILAVIAVGLATAACNTVAGAGKDTASVGHAVTDTADDAKGK